MTTPSNTPVANKFMCLEDRLLDTLYQQEGPVCLKSLADPISITTDAASSIVHRISKSFPLYILSQSEGEEILFSPNMTQRDVVQAFLMQGGFTQINEAEFIAYYKRELAQEKRRQLLHKLKHPSTWKRWVQGTCLLLVSSLTAATLYQVYLVKGKSKRY